jgi:uncharacterized protein (DUF4415 family)
MAPRKLKTGSYRRRSRRKDEPTLEEFPDVRGWMVADRGDFYRPLKDQITLRLDKDVLAWFKKGGEGYQTRINEVLRAYVRSRVSEGEGRRQT